MKARRFRLGGGLLGTFLVQNLWNLRSRRICGCCNPCPWRFFALEGSPPIPKRKVPPCAQKRCREKSGSGIEVSGGHRFPSQQLRKRLGYQDAAETGCKLY